MSCSILKFFSQIVIFFNITQDLCVFKRHCKIFQYVLFRCKALKSYRYINRVGVTCYFSFNGTVILLYHSVISRIYWKIYVAAKKLSLLPRVPSQKVPKWLVSLGTKFFVTFRRFFHNGRRRSIFCARYRITFITDEIIRPASEHSPHFTVLAKLSYGSPPSFFPPEYIPQRCTVSFF